MIYTQKDICGVLECALRAAEHTKNEAEFRGMRRMADAIALAFDLSPVILPTFEMVYEDPEPTGAELEVNVRALSLDGLRTLRLIAAAPRLLTTTKKLETALLIIAHTLQLSGIKLDSVADKQHKEALLEANSLIAEIEG